MAERSGVHGVAAAGASTAAATGTSAIAATSSSSAASSASSFVLAPSGTPRCACGIDIHAHIVPGHFPSYLGSTIPASWPSMADAPPQRGLCHRHVMIAGKTYRTVSEQCWSVPRRLSDLAGMGLKHQAISPMPELLSYWMDASDAQPLLRFLNEQIAEMCAASDGVLLGLGAVPLQDVDLAIQELRHVIETLGFAGVEIGSNINGVPIGDPRFLPFFEACVALDAAVLVHAIKPAGMDRLIGPPPLQQVLAYPTDVGLAAASVITGGLMQQLPSLRLAFSHGGGTLAMLLPRLQQGWQVFPALRDSIPESPIEQARKLFYDTLVFDAQTLSHLVARFGSSQLMLGTDYPFNFHDRTPLDSLAAAGLDAAALDQVTAGNAKRFLARAFALPS
jgi:aminocarboxymuconate-semialdehyde decarboxylase